ncbi:uncharacterized protein GGS22DRAFT_200101 [Annulohypoxylon maeteangense]|uniref:uncharacterized protein n=1 Tax=Annulohypoxylon maeteangense TaxID=1927788 RepID=UPI002008362B|nr:uncharacterized protein GGS22DRAFT_200101 [Annulohypoxylon maeteangense]KAI0885009.1 hypothetical protein GGS22DRAFT_200101 [Annulohypoxylon maeteangense]
MCLQSIAKSVSIKVEDFGEAGDQIRWLTAIPDTCEHFYRNDELPRCEKSKDPSDSVCIYHARCPMGNCMKGRIQIQIQSIAKEPRYKREKYCNDHECSVEECHDLRSILGQGQVQYSKYCNERKQTNVKKGAARQRSCTTASIVKLIIDASGFQALVIAQRRLGRSTAQCIFNARPTVATGRKILAQTHTHPIARVIHAVKGNAEIRQIVIRRGKAIVTNTGVNAKAVANVKQSDPGSTSVAHDTHAEMTTADKRDVLRENTVCAVGKSVLPNNLFGH